MATSTVLTNKPINPRGDDNRPVDSYNRASLYSGKALDFDGVNDDITIPNSDSINITGNALTIAGYINTDGSTAWQGICYKDFGNGAGYQLFVANGTNSIAFGIRTGGFYRLYSNEVIENNKWYFVVATYDGVNQSIYINGVFDNSQAATGNITDSSLYNLYIGRNNGGSERFNGEIGGFKIFNTALTAAQVADLYNNPEKVVPTGVDNTALKLWLPMMEGAGTTCINGASDALGNEILTQPIDIGADFNANAGGVIVDADTFTTAGGLSDGIISSSLIQAGKTYRLEIQGTTTSSGFTFGNGGTGSGNEYGAGFGVHYFTAAHQTLWFRQGTAGTTDITTFSIKELKSIGTISGATWTHGIGAPVAQTAVIDWNKHPFNVSTDILIPQGLTAGRDIGGSLFENVRKQGALNLDGNSWAEVHDNGSLDFGAGSFTLEAWARAKYVSQGSSLNAIMTLGDSSNSTTSASINIISSGGSKPQSYYRGAGTTATNAQTDGDWFHIVGIYDGTNMNMYINGALDNSNARVASSITNDFVKMIGRDTTGVRYYNDQIAQPRIYNRALTASEVLNNYNATKDLYI